MPHFVPEDRRGRRLLFTPGPLTTSRTVREAMLIDIGSWDTDSIEVTAEIRSRLVALAGGSEALTSTPLQGSGTYGVEAMLGCAVPPGGKLLILVNGAYGHRMTLIADALKIPYRKHVDPEDRVPDPAAVDAVLAQDREVTHVACVHGETTTGILNPIREIGLVVARHRRRFLVDAISTFGAYPVGPGQAIDFDAGPIDHLVLPANKCIEGVPGLCFVLSRREAMERCAGQARSLSLDLHGQWRYMEETGRFRYTPPTHVMLAFLQALRELEEEGGIDARGRRYRENQQVLAAGMRDLGFRPYVSPEHQSSIITAFHHPHPRFDFDSFYQRLHRRGYIIYPGKVSQAETFRIASIGRIDADDMRGLLRAVREVVDEGI